MHVCKCVMHSDSVPSYLHNMRDRVTGYLGHFSLYDVIVEIPQFFWRLKNMSGKKGNENINK